MAALAGGLGLRRWLLWLASAGGGWGLPAGVSACGEVAGWGVWLLGFRLAQVAASAGFGWRGWLLGLGGVAAGAGGVASAGGGGGCLLGFRLAGRWLAGESGCWGFSLRGWLARLASARAQGGSSAGLAGGGGWLGSRGGLLASARGSVSARWRACFGLGPGPLWFGACGWGVVGEISVGAGFG